MTLKEVIAELEEERVKAHNDFHSVQDRNRSSFAQGQERAYSHALRVIRRLDRAPTQTGETKKGG